MRIEGLKGFYGRNSTKNPALLDDDEFQDSSDFRINPDLSAMVRYGFKNLLATPETNNIYEIARIDTGDNTYDLICTTDNIKRVDGPVTSTLFDTVNSKYPLLTKFNNNVIFTNGKDNVKRAPTTDRNTVISHTTTDLQVYDNAFKSIATYPSRGINITDVATDGNNMYTFDNESTNRKTLNTFASNGIKTNTTVIKNFALNGGPTLDVAWSPTLGLFVAVGVNTIATSSDGITWTQTNIPYQLYAVIWNPTRSEFMAVGAGISYQSSNGTSWTLKTLSGLTGSDVAWSPTLNMYVVVTQETYIMKLDNTTGFNAWQTVYSGTSGWLAITWSPDLGRFCATGSSYSIVSANGTAWSAYVIPGTGYIYDITWSPSLARFCAFSYQNGLSMLSADGQTWTTSSVGYGLTGIAWSPELSLFVGTTSSADLIYTSSNGTSWTRIFYTAGRFNRLTWCSDLGRFVMVGQNIISSEDGVVPGLVGANESYKIVLNNTFGDLCSVLTRVDNVTGVSIKANVPGYISSSKSMVVDGAHIYLIGYAKTSPTNLFILKFDMNLALVSATDTGLPYATFANARITNANDNLYFIGNTGSTKIYRIVKTTMVITAFDIPSQLTSVDSIYGYGNNEQVVDNLGNLISVSTGIVVRNFAQTTNYTGSFINLLYVNNALEDWYDITAPTDCSAVEYSAAGVIGNGVKVQKWKYTWYSSSTDLETSTSKESNQLKLDTAQAIVWLDDKASTILDKPEADLLQLSNFELYRQDSATADFGLVRSVPMFFEATQDLSGSLTDTRLYLSDLQTLTPVDDPFVIKMDSEYMLVTAIVEGTPLSGLVPAVDPYFTITRAYNGSAVTDHSTVSTIYTAAIVDNVAVADLGGKPLTINQFVDPMYYSIVYQNRLILARSDTSPTKIMWSGFNTTTLLPDEDIWEANAFEFVGKDDGEPITGIANYQGNLIVFKKNSTYYITGTLTPGNYAVTKISAFFGCTSHKSIVDIAGGLFFMSYRGPCFMYGTDITLLSDDIIEDLVQKINWTKADLITSCIVPKYNEVQVSIPISTIGENNTILCWNYSLYQYSKKKSSFYTFNRAVTILRTLFSETGIDNFVYYSADQNGQLIQEDVYKGSDNGTTAINAYLTTKDINFTYDQFKKFRQVILDLLGTGTVTMEVDTGSGFVPMGEPFVSTSAYKKYWKNSLPGIMGNFARFKFIVNTKDSWFTLYNLALKYKEMKIR